MPPRFDGAIAAVATKIDAAVQPGPILWTSLVLGFAMIAWLRLSQPPPRRGLNRPPLAPGSVPLLGHALAFKKDPAGFLTACCEAVGPVFRLNMAGKRFVVVGPSRAAMAQVAMANESVLSARQAVMDVGFKETLGPLNVGVGTDLHKRAVKQAFGGEKLGDEAAPLLRALEAAFEQQLAAVAVVSDFVALVRRCVLRCVIERLFGTAVLRAAGESFLDAFMEFQDAVEDATAKAAVLPRRVALLLILAPVQARRAVVSGRLAAAIEAAWQGSEGWGPWLHTFRGDAVSAADAGEMGCGASPGGRSLAWVARRHLAWSLALRTAGTCSQASSSPRTRTPQSPPRKPCSSSSRPKPVSEPGCPPPSTGSASRMRSRCAQRLAPRWRVPPPCWSRTGSPGGWPSRRAVSPRTR